MAVDRGRRRPRWAALPIIAKTESGRSSGRDSQSGPVAPRDSKADVTQWGLQSGPIQFKDRLGRVQKCHFTDLRLCGICIGQIDAATLDLDADIGVDSASCAQCGGLGITGAQRTGRLGTTCGEQFASCRRRVMPLAGNKSLRQLKPLSNPFESLSFPR